MLTPRWKASADAAIVAIESTAEGGVAALSEDGSLTVLGGGGQVVSRFELPRGATVDHDDVTTFEPPTALQSESASAKGWVVAYAHQNHLVRVAGSATSVLAEHPSAVAAMRVAGEQVVVARFDGVELWTLAGQRRWQHEGGPFEAVTLVGNGKTVVALKADGELVFLSQRNGSLTGRLKLAVTEAPHTWHLAAIEGNRFALGLGEWLLIVDAAKETVFRRTRLRDKVAALAATDRWVLLGLEDGSVQRVDPLTGETRGVLAVHPTPVRSVALGKGVFFSSSGTEVRAWDEALLSGAPVAASPVTALAARGALAAVGAKSGRLRIQRGVEEVGSMRLDGSVGFVHVAADESVVAVSSSLLVRLQKPWKTPQPIVLDAPCKAFAADESYAFSGSEHGVVDVFQLAGGKKITSYELTDAPISALLRLRGVHLVVGTDGLDGRLFVVDVAEAQIVHRIEAHQDAFGVTSLATEPRGRIVASGSDDGTIALLDVAKGKVLARLTVGEAPVSLAFDPTGKRLVAALVDGSVTLIALDQRGATSQLNVPPTARVAWGEASNQVLCGLTDGRIEQVTVG
jgi:outer membrane protein assembly factor BamB